MSEVDNVTYLHKRRPKEDATERKAKARSKAVAEKVAVNVTPALHSEAVIEIRQELAARTYLNGDDLIAIKKGGVVEYFTDVYALMDYSAENCTFFKEGKNGPNDVEPPFPLFKRVFARTAEVPAPKVDYLTTIPYCTATGRLVTKSGYDADSRVYLTLDLELRKGLSELRDDEAAAIGARDYLLAELFADFPFRGRHREGPYWWKQNGSIAGAIALMLQAIVRPVIAGGTPLYGITAPSDRTGKGLLLDALLYPVLGATSNDVSHKGVLKLAGNPRDGADWNKNILAALRDSPQAIILDNIEHMLQSAELASALTSPTYAGRLLGASRVIKVSNRCIWALTANNLQTSGELGKRCCPIELDAGVARPDLRDGFRHADLLGYVGRARRKIVRALLTIVRYWISLGMPRGSSPTIGGFETWSAVMSGILESIGINGLLSNRETWLSRTNLEGDDAERFVAGWLAGLVDGVENIGAPVKPEMTALELLALVNDLGVFNVAGSTEDSQVRSMGRVLAKHLDKHIAGYMLKYRSLHGRKLYRLEKVDESP